MKVRIEMDESLEEEESVIRCRKIDETILRLQAAVMEREGSARSITLRQGDTEYYLPLGEILFFETENKIIYAHTRDKMLVTKYKLYELEGILPGSFLRISKSAQVPVAIWNLKPQAVVCLHRNFCLGPGIIAS
ncbi:MAG: LytTR family transcriptional regulator [Lachnospiraceae bacterium]|nr:LytTR family transcriptional regulator [Lachnospiraceae bacterium]